MERAARAARARLDSQPWGDDGGRLIGLKMPFVALFDDDLDDVEVDSEGNAFESESIESELDDTPPLSISALNTRSRSILEESGWRIFTKNGEDFAVQDKVITRPHAGISFENRNGGGIHRFSVASLPTPTYLGNDKRNRAIYAKDTGFTVTDIDSGRKPSGFPPRTVGYIKTTRGWQIIQRGHREDLAARNDPSYVQMSREREHWNLRTYDKEGKKERTLYVRLADLKEEWGGQLVESWKLAGGIVRGFRGYWSGFRSGKGKVL